MLNYVNRVLVGIPTGADSNNDTLASLGRGDMLVLDSNMTPITAAPADNQGPRASFYVAIGTGVAKAPFILSSPIFGDSVKSYLGKTNSPGVEQVSYVGFNGTAGNIDAIIDGDSYQVIVAFKDRQRLLANKQTRQVLSAVATSTSRFDVLNDIAGNASYSTPYSDPFGIKVEVVSNGTATTSDNNIAVNTGSKVITFTTAATHNTGTLFAIDDYIGIDDVTYKIVAVDGLNITLSRAFTGATGTVVAANVDALAAPSNFGLKITGVESPYNNPEIDVYEKVSFEIGVSENLGSDIVDYAVAVDLGNGTSEQVKALEFAVQHNLGISNFTQWPIPSIDFHTVAGVVYDTIQITASDKHEGDLQGQMESPVGLTIAFSATSNAQRNNITPILDALIPNASALNGTW